MNRRLLSIGVAALVVLVLDQISKWLLSDIAAGDGGDRWLIDEWIGFTPARNSGIAFGLLQDRGGLVVWLALAATIVAGALFARQHADSWIGAFGIGLIAGGALGNLADRVQLGYVRDFFTLGPIPPFNVADAAITLGTCLLLGSLLLTGDPSGATETELNERLNATHRIEGTSL